MSDIDKIIAPDPANSACKAVLFAMMIATKTTSPAATDISKEPPLSINNENEHCDHKEHGRTICV
ncbi:hypothetical protein OEA41_006879 [Lepraria neglecta]|uniref:Uncharacterized protein n=1 Tax=Lepraria neglecta TaxID=209136 RepID=A0AAD9Z8H1_9LECA|nr:hypothetical protein OEA41_006879 [Lepraria neglecta]